MMESAPLAPFTASETCPHCGALLEPPKKGRRKYPFARLVHVGDAIQLRLDFRDPEVVKRVRYAARSYAENHGMRVTVRTVPGGALVKRIA